MDFEDAFKAFADVFKMDTKLGCYFHYLYANMRKLRELKLIKCYKNYQFSFFEEWNLLVRGCHLPDEERDAYFLNQIEHVMRSIPLKERKTLALNQLLTYHV